MKFRRANFSTQLNFIVNGENGVDVLYFLKNGTRQYASTVFFDIQHDDSINTYQISVGRKITNNTSHIIIFKIIEIKKTHNKRFIRVLQGTLINSVHYFHYLNVMIERGRFGMQ